MAKKIKNIPVSSPLSTNNGKEGAYTLFTAIYGNDIETVKALLQSGVSPNIIDDGDQEATPLIVACMKGKFDIASLLIEYGADVNACDAYDWVPVMYAIKQWPITQVETEEFLTVLISNNVKADSPVFEDQHPLVFGRKRFDYCISDDDYDKVMKAIKTITKNVAQQKQFEKQMTKIQPDYHFAI